MITFDGFHVVVSPLLPTVTMVAHPRSAGRAKRRAAQGHRQHQQRVETHAYWIGHTLHVSGEAWEELRRSPKVEKREARTVLVSTPSGLSGGSWLADVFINQPRLVNPFVNPAALST